MAALAVLVCLVYRVVVPGALLADDLSFLQVIASWVAEGHLGVGFGSEFVSTTLNSEGNFYRPLAVLSFGGDFLVWGIWSGGWHLTNLALHIANALLLWAVVARIAGRPLGEWAGGGAALLFALRPLAPEVVAWVSGRPDALALFGSLVALLAYMKAHGKRGRWYGVALVAFAGALGSKEAAILLPTALVALHLSGCLADERQQGSQWATALRGIVPFALLLLIYFLGRWLLFGSFVEVYQDRQTVGIAGLRDLLARVPPLFLFFVGDWHLGALLPWLAGMTGGLLVLGAVGARWGGAGRRLWLFGVLWLGACLVTLLPSLGVSAQGEGTRLLYLPAAPLAALLAAPLAAQLPPFQRLRSHRWLSRALLGGVALLSWAVLRQWLCPWGAAYASMQPLLPAIAARAAEVPPNQTHLLIVPDHLGGALFARNGQGQLMSPPLQVQVLSPSVFVYAAPTPCTLPPEAMVNNLPVVATWCWDVGTQQFKQQNQLGASTSPAFWQPSQCPTTQVISQSTMRDWWQGVRK